MLRLHFTTWPVRSFSDSSSSGIFSFLPRASDAFVLVSMQIHLASTIVVDLRLATSPISLRTTPRKNLSKIAEPIAQTFVNNDLLNS